MSPIPPSTNLLTMLSKLKSLSQGGVVIGDFDNSVYVASQKAIYCLVPLSFDKQVRLDLI